MDSEQHRINLNNEEACQHPAYDTDIENINKPNDNGETALHIAAGKGCRYCCEKLIKSGANLAARNKNMPTPFKIIYRKIDKPVDFLITNIFNKSINYEGQNKQKLCEMNDPIKLDFTPLVPIKDGNQMDVISNLLEVIKEKNQRHKLMDHPFIKAFLELKWGKVKNYYYATILAYMVFVGLLSAYVMILISSWPKESKPIEFQIIRWFVVVGVLIMVIQVGLQGYYLRKVYFKQFETYVHLGTVITSLLITLCITKNKKEWILHVASIAILLAWINLIMLLGRLPRIGYYSILFSRVLKNVCEVIAIFSFLIFGFALSFSVQFHQEFSNVWGAFAKTLTMATGDFNYEELFDTSFRADPDPNPIHGLKFTSHILFLVFVMVMNITLMNLMVGLSVNEIKILHKEGEILRLIKQVQYLKYIENMNWLKRFCRGINQEKVIDLNKDVGNSPWKIISYDTFDLMTMNAEVNDKNENNENPNPIINSNIPRQDENRSNLNGTGLNLNKNEVNLNGTDLNLNETGKNLNETDSNLNETGINLNGAGLNLNETGINFNGTGLNLNETGINLNEVRLRRDHMDFGETSLRQGNFNFSQDGTETRLFQYSQGQTTTSRTVVKSEIKTKQTRQSTSFIVSSRDQP